MTDNIGFAPVLEKGQNFNNEIADTFICNGKFANRFVLSATSGRDGAILTSTDGWNWEVSGPFLNRNSNPSGLELISSINAWAPKIAGQALNGEWLATLSTVFEGRSYTFEARSSNILGPYYLVQALIKDKDYYGIDGLKTSIKRGDKEIPGIIGHSASIYNPIKRDSAIWFYPVDDNGDDKLVVDNFGRKAIFRPKKKTMFLAEGVHPIRTSDDGSFWVLLSGTNTHQPFEYGLYGYKIDWDKNRNVYKPRSIGQVTRDAMGENLFKMYLNDYVKKQYDNIHSEEIKRKYWGMDKDQVLGRLAYDYINRGLILRSSLEVINFGHASVIKNGRQGKVFGHAVAENAFDVSQKLRLNDFVTYAKERRLCITNYVEEDINGVSIPNIGYYGMAFSS